MIIECPYCESKVDGEVLAEHKSFEAEAGSYNKISLLECPICKNAILVGQELIQTGPHEVDWTVAKRL